MQRYDLSRGTVVLEVRALLRRERADGRVVGRGHFCSCTASARGTPYCGSITLRPVLVPTMLQQILDVRPMRFPPVILDDIPEPLDAGLDATCAVCLEDCAAGAGSGAGMLPCRHIFHTVCIDKWLADHNECPTCKHVVRAELPADVRRDPFGLSARSAPHSTFAARLIIEDHVGQTLFDNDTRIETIGTVGFATAERGPRNLSPRAAALADLHLSLRNLVCLPSRYAPLWSCRPV